MVSVVSPDGIHLTIPYSYHKSILNRFGFFQPINLNTGEIKLSKHGNEIWEAEEKNVRFQYIKSPYGTNHLHVRTSLPIFYTGKNCVNINRSDYQNAIRELSSFINVPMLDLVIRSFEFGYNARLETHSSHILMDSIVAFKNRIPDRNSFNSSGLQLTFPHQHFTLKIYDKGKQMKLPYEIPRIEMVIHKMIYSRRHLGVENLNQMQLPDSQQQMEVQLRKKIDDLVIVDPLLKKLPPLIPSQTETIYKYSSPHFWRDLKPHERSYHLKILDSLNAKLDSNLKDELLLPLNIVKQNQSFLTRK